MKKKLPYFPLYYGIVLLIINIYKTINSYLEYQRLYRQFGIDIDSIYLSLIDAASLHIVLAILFIISVIFKNSKLLLIYYSLFLLVELHLYLLSMFDIINIPIVRFVGIVGIPIFVIIPQMTAIVLLIKYIKSINKIN